MGENIIDGKVVIKQKEIEVEIDPTKRSELRKELEILNLRKQLIFTRSKIKQIKNSMT